MKFKYKYHGYERCKVNGTTNIMILRKGKMLNLIEPCFSTSLLPFTEMIIVKIVICFSVNLLNLRCNQRN